MSGTSTEQLHFFTCPHCCQGISMVLDLSVTCQSYVEDCEVCCRPIEIAYASPEQSLDHFSARPAW